MSTPNAEQGTDPKATLHDKVDALVAGWLESPEDTPPTDEVAETPAVEETDEQPDTSEPDAAEVEGDETDTPEDAEDTPQDTDEDPLVTVKIDGKDEQVPLSEALAGYSRTRDYTRKTQQVAEQRKKLDEEYKQTVDARGKLIDVLEKAEIAVKAMLPEDGQEPDWDKMAEELSPEEVLKAQSEHRGYRQRLKKIQDHIEQQRQAQFAEAQTQADKIAKDESALLLAALPAWKDEKVRTAGRKAVVEYALSLGFTVAQLGAVTDHRLVVLLEKARRLDAGEGKAAGKTGIKTSRPGAPTARKALDPASDERKRTMRNLAKTGSKRDAIAAFEALNLD